MFVLFCEPFVVAACRSTLVCRGCGRQSDKLEPFLFFSLPIPVNSTGRSRAKSRRPCLAVYVTVVRQTTSRREPAVRHAFELPASRRSTVAKLRRLISQRTGVPRQQVLHSAGRAKQWHLFEPRQLQCHITCKTPHIYTVWTTIRPIHLFISP